MAKEVAGAMDASASKEVAGAMDAPAPKDGSARNGKAGAKDTAGTKCFVLRVDSATMDALERWAADDFRSINGQLQWIISEALRKSGRLKKKG